MNKVKFAVTAKTDTFKVLQSSAKADSQIPVHVASKDAILMVHTGSIHFRLDVEDLELTGGDHMLIPAGTQHQFKVLQDAQLTLILDTDTQIKFL